MTQATETVSTPTDADLGGASISIPNESLARLFLRFLRFGFLAWGGPVAQIGMLRHAFVDEGRWVTSEHFNRVLALYQVLPGPEAHELCVYFGMLARGRLGGILAGLGFMLPGFCLMFLLSWLYVHFGLDMHGQLAALFAAVQAAVVALIVRAAHRIGSHVLHDRRLAAIAVLAVCGHLLGVHFAILLLAGGMVYSLRKSYPSIAGAACGAIALAMGLWVVTNGLLATSPLAASATVDVSVAGRLADQASGLELFWSGLKAGLLTFGGAYTVIPFLQRDAVSQGAWMTNGQFMDGIALSGLLPAPLVIFGTFVGYIGGGPIGAIAMTAGIFLPAFAFTLLAHDPLERAVSNPALRVFLDGLTAAVVGLIAGTTITLLLASMKSVLAAVVFLFAVIALFRWSHRWIVPLVVASAAAVGALATIVL